MKTILARICHFFLSLKKMTKQATLSLFHADELGFYCIFIVYSYVRRTLVINLFF